VEKFNVGGYWLDRPFQTRRLGHFHFFSDRMADAMHFYTNLLGFQVSDSVDMRKRFPPGVEMSELDATLYFTRYGGDHHAFVLCSMQMMTARGRSFAPGVTVGQITWQVGSLMEVVRGEEWFQKNKLQILKSGRDTPGSNWHTYTPDPDGHPNELYYGMEQIGWDGLSKPHALHRGFHTPPELPQIAEYQEIEQAVAKGVDISTGNRFREPRAFDFDVDGVRMPRPFRVTGIGPVRLFVDDMEASLRFYTQRIGLRVTEEIVWNGHRCIFLRCGTEHHSLALYPIALRAELGLSQRSKCFSFGARVNDYQQLRNCIAFLKKEGVTIKHLPPELFPGMEYCAFAADPDGHLIQLHAYMEQVGWDGRPRPADQRRKIDNAAWPEALEPSSDNWCGEPFFGPWA
jgi:catechol 2,3-dioxygenase-like lactoylglutathione lyase family enzyme